MIPHVQSNSYVFPPHFQESLSQSGAVTKEQMEALLRQQSAIEQELEQKMMAKRDQQMAALRSRLAARKKKRLDAIRENHEHEKMEVSVFWNW